MNGETRARSFSTAILEANQAINSTPPQPSKVLHLNTETTVENTRQKYVHVNEPTERETTRKITAQFIDAHQFREKNWLEAV